MIGMGIPRARLVLTYDGIDAGRFRSGVRHSRQDVRCELRVPDGRLLILLVSHFRTWKGQDLALEALARVTPEARRQLYLVLAGPTAASAKAYRDGLVRTVSANGLASDVAFLEERSDVADLMNAADVVLHASTIPEPFGLVVLEGLTLGKPVIASRLGGPGEVIVPGAGVTFDPSDPTELAGILTRLSSQPGLAATLGPKATERAADFPISRTVDVIQQVYSDLLSIPSKAG
jgi:glycosyltransferase involved in cell wall biosynthesis